ncbi:hypothetical protein [Dyadobacter sediminis]|uniref:DUF3826 domain-containing protein n=1 Tax=Dyadobacter sediminis TaxID=1493691 RepID=A0A5R9K943_9BACT|nr:hypothetical protein [Dyadobacter sediminis]TLU90558.1 hypothetical protein FEM55_18555 [Dyadobacter sediminis]GGC08786.1 hypothetical protein GCM10011325_39640 [Dyadobacter sediminis]
MKNKIALLITAVCLCFLNFRFSEDYSEFGVTHEDVEEKFWSTLQNKSVYAPYLSSSAKAACRSISPDHQAAAVQKAGNLIKLYYGSQDFKKRYNNWLAKSFPQEEVEISEERKAEIRENKIRDIKSLNAKDMEPIVDIQIQAGESITGMESMLTSLPPDQRAEFKKQIEDSKRTVAFFKKVKPLLKSDFEAFKKQYAAFLAQDEIAQAEQQLIRSNKNNAEEFDQWKSPEKVLAARLTEFLEKSKGVDFAAKTKEVNNRKKFVDAAYEGQNDVWKFCYRIGPAPTNAARAFAQQWLTELKQAD